MRLSPFYLVALVISLQASAGTEPVPSGRLPDSVTPHRYRLTLTVDPRQSEFAGLTDIDVTIREPVSTIWLHGRGLRVSQARLVAPSRTIAGRYEEVDPVSGVSRLELDTPAQPGRAVLSFRYTAPFQQTPQGLYRVAVSGEWYAFSQMEPIDARRVFPGFDEPRFKTPFEVTVISHPRDRVIANAPLKSKATASGRSTHSFRATLPLPTYLVAVAVGPLDVVDARSLAPSKVRRRPLPLRFVTTKGQGKKLAFVLRETPGLVQRLERYFGLPFPYPKLDLIASPIHGFAMENAGAIVFDDVYLLIGADPVPRQQARFANVVAHEVAHQWFGDLVTPVWWDDLWLNESFAQWLGSKISDAWRPGLGIGVDQLARTLQAMDTDSLRAGRAIHQAIDENRQIMSAFDDITYQKGAGVLGMVESYLGEERFRRGVRMHLERHPHGTATAADFFAAMAAAADEPAIVEAFRSFVDQPGVPLVSVALSAEGTSFTLQQSRYRPLGSAIEDGQLWKIPVCVRLEAVGQPPKICTLSAGAITRMPINAPTASPRVFPNAGGQGYYRFVLDRTSRQALTDGADSLPAREAVALADSVGAAFAAGQLPFDELLRAAAVLAAHPERAAATKLGNFLIDLHDSIPDAGTREGLARRLVEIHGPRLRALGYEPAAGAYAKDSADRHLLRRALALIVALSGRDAEIRKTLADAAAGSLKDPEVLDAGMRSRAWAVGVQELAPSFADGLVKQMLESGDPQVRQDAAYGLGHAEQADVAARVRSLLLDPRVSPELVIVMLRLQVDHPATRDATWTWVTENGDALIARMPTWFQPFLASMGDRFCEARRRDALESFLGPRLAKAGMDGLPLARDLERIDLCIALMKENEAAIKTAVTGGEAARVR